MFPHSLGGRVVHCVITATQHYTKDSSGCDEEKIKEHQNWKNKTVTICRSCVGVPRDSRIVFGLL